MNELSIKLFDGNGVRNMCELDWGGQTWQLRADRTVWWPARRTLIVADLHFGKAEHFRRSGIPVPRGTTRHNTERLDVALQATGAERLIVLGDFFHSKGGVTDDLVEHLIAWRQRWDGLRVINVRGNHDRQAGDPPCEVGIDCVSGPWRDGEGGGEGGGTVAFAHEPAVMSNAVTWCGHLHPAVMLEGLAHARLRTACFHVQVRSATLPAFGAFTGMKIIRPRRGDRVYAVGPGQIVEVTPPVPDEATNGTSLCSIGKPPGRGRRRSPQY